MEHLKAHKTITPMEAFSIYGITKLATRISELRRQGVQILGDWVETENVYGDKVRFKSYRLGASD
jgi:hypothetical protein